LALAHLFARVTRSGDSEVTFSVLQAATCNYRSNHSKEKTISLSALPKVTTSGLAGLSSSLEGLVHYFSMQVVINKCFFLNPKKIAPLIPKNDVTEG